jgi:hypothetical protein
MGLSFRRFLIAQDGSLHRLANTKFDRMLQDPGGHGLPAFAGQRVRMAHVVVELVDRVAPLLTYQTELPHTLGTVLADRSSGRFRLDFSNIADESYWMNHCSECDAKIGDWFTTKPGKAFFPTIEAEIAKVYGARVQGPWVFKNPRLSVSSWTTLWLKSQSDSH